MIHSVNIGITLGTISLYQALIMRLEQNYCRRSASSFQRLLADPCRRISPTHPSLVLHYRCTCTWYSTSINVKDQPAPRTVLGSSWRRNGRGIDSASVFIRGLDSQVISWTKI